MPTLWAIYDSQNNLWCSRYSVNLNFCTWGNADNAQIFSLKQDADNAISAWGQTPGERYIGKNPKLHP
jgi:hypothetical protein